MIKRDTVSKYYGLYPYKVVVKLDYLKESGVPEWVTRLNYVKKNIKGDAPRRRIENKKASFFFLEENLADRFIKLNKKIVVEVFKPINDSAAKAMTNRTIQVRPRYYNNKYKFKIIFHWTGFDKPCPVEKWLSSYFDGSDEKRFKLNKYYPKTLHLLDEVDFVMVRMSLDDYIYRYYECVIHSDLS